MFHICGQNPCKECSQLFQRRESPFLAKKKRKFTENCQETGQWVQKRETGTKGTADTEGRGQFPGDDRFSGESWNQICFWGEICQNPAPKYWKQKKQPSRRGILDLSSGNGSKMEIVWTVLPTLSLNKGPISFCNRARNTIVFSIDISETSAWKLNPNPNPFLKSQP